MKYTTILILSLFLALVLELLALSSYIEPFRPQFLLLVTIFWSLHTNKQFGILSAWFIGLLYDLALNDIVGLNAFIFALSCFLIKRQSKWLLKLSVVEQAITFSGLFFIQITLSYIAHAFLGFTHNTLHFWDLFSIITSACIWPLLSILLADLCYIFKVQLR